MSEPNPDCENCGGAGGVYVTFDPYPMGYPCECTQESETPYD